jgi:hypothetical protein
MMRRSKTGLLHVLSWYPKTYGIPVQTVVNAYKRGWNLDDPQGLLERLLSAPGPKSKGLQPLIDFVNGQQGPSTLHRGSSRNARKPKAESTVTKPVREQGDDPVNLRIELTIGSSIYWRMITAAEADKVMRSTIEPWQTRRSCAPESLARSTTFRTDRTEVS